MKKILLIHTGGTFGMMPTEPQRTLAPADIRHVLLKYLPDVETIAHIDFDMPFNIDSANMQPHHWQTLGEIIVQNYDHYHGFVIIHGTDSMVYTASALSFMLKGLDKPVILTGSQRPLAHIRSDARSNLINSLELATYPIPEVAIFFGTKLLRGNRAIKLSSTHYDAFASPNFPPLAEVGLDIRLSGEIAKPGIKLMYDDRFDTRVFSFRFYPGLSPDFLESFLRSSLQAVVVEAMGLGNVAIEENSLIPWVREMSRSGKLVVVRSQNPYGYVNLNLYECGKQIQEAGAVSAQDMTTEATLIKLMYLLAQTAGDIPSIRRLISQPLAGEISAEPE